MDPVEDLLYIIISNRTGAAVASRVYDNVRKTFPSWDLLTNSSAVILQQLLAPAGLSIKRSAQILGILNALRSSFGSVTLQPLQHWPDDRAEAYLVSLPGVSNKVAKCVLMYTLGRQVLPVDVHVHRVTQRLGWHRHKRADQSHSTLESLVDGPLRYNFHVNCVAHGRSACKASDPACERCSITSFCHYYQTVVISDEKL